MANDTIHTGAAPVTASNSVFLSKVISGGTGGTEIIYLQDFSPLQAGGSVFPNAVGQKRVFYLSKQTNPSDSVVVKHKDYKGQDQGWRTFNTIHTFLGDNPTGFVIDSVEDMITFEWSGSEWLFDNSSGDDNENVFGPVRLAIGTPTADRTTLTLTGTLEFAFPILPDRRIAFIDIQEIAGHDVIGGLHITIGDNSTPYVDVVAAQPVLANSWVTVKDADILKRSFKPGTFGFLKVKPVTDGNGAKVNIQVTYNTVGPFD